MPQAALAQFRKRWLLIVAVGRYADRPLMPDLPGVLKDANRLSEVLRRHGLAPRADTVCLFNEHATRDRILDAIRVIARDAPEPDQVVIWFGGHGHEQLDGDSQMPDGMTRYLLPHDATSATAATHGLSTRVLGEALSRLRADEVVVILDCCHAGGLTPLFAQELGRLLQGHKSRFVLAAARHVQQALDADSLDRGGPLTQSFCDALEGLVADAVAADGRVSATAAGRHAREYVRREAAQFGHAQDAVAFDFGDPIDLAGPSSPPGKQWVPRVCYPLQPAPHFQGRERLRQTLATWAGERETAVRVASLVAVGGTGKTALAERIAHDLGERPPAGLFVWSFYEDPRTEGFLRTACEYFTGEAPGLAAGLLERLQTALTGDEPHLLVLDGLERVQSEGARGRPRGEIEDSQLRWLLQWLATGKGTRARALVTTRFPLIDLANWTPLGRHREERLDDLEPAAARAVLRDWGVKGDDATLDALAAPVHYHALSVAVLGSYLGKLWDGDPTKAPTFDRQEEAATDQKAARLTRILTRYAEKLPNVERDLLACLAAFQRGVTVESLGFVADAGGEVAGSLAGCNQAKLLRHLHQLRDLGLVFRYDIPQEATFTAHPFLRDYFRDLLGVTRAPQIHEAVRARLAPSLDAKPARKPTDAAMLSRYETLVEHTRLAGGVREAFELYSSALGGYEHLGWVLGDNARGLRVVSGFSPDGSPESTAPDLPTREREELLAAWGLFAKDLGDLASARRVFAVDAELSRRDGHPSDLSVALQHQADVELLAGRLPLARRAAQGALVEANRARDPVQRRNSHACLACALARLGHRDEARSHFASAALLEQKPFLYGLRGIWDAEFKLATGAREGALIQTWANRQMCARHDWTRDQALCDTLLGLLDLPGDPVAARKQLDAARGYTSRSGCVEIRLRCHHLAAEIARAERAFPLALREAETGLQLATTRGYGHSAVVLYLSLARIHLEAGDPVAARRDAGEALARSTDPDGRFGWGEADALHLVGVAHARLGEIDLALQRLSAALAKRQQLSHPGLSETRAELDRLHG